MKLIAQMGMELIEQMGDVKGHDFSRAEYHRKTTGL
jgi:hypothetical protein